MKKHSEFPKIGQYRQVVKEARDRAAYVGRDANGDPIYDPSKASPTINGVFIFGEWAGGSIQKKVAISNIEKSFFIFDVKIVPEDGSESYHLPSDYLRNKERRIYNIEDFETYEIEIDFNQPEAVQNKW